MSLERKRVLVPGETLTGKVEIVCKMCGCKHFEVVNSLPWTEQGKPRRRQCRNCGWILKTIETPVEDDSK